MKKFFTPLMRLSLVALCAYGLATPVSAQLTDYTVAGVTQIGNSDFEDWSGVSNNNAAPNNWNSFQTADGGLKSFLPTSPAVQDSTEIRPGSSGERSVRIFAQTFKVFGIVNVTAQGNLTLGCIHAGGSSAEHKDNYNYSITNGKNSEGTVVDSEKFSETLTARPDSIVFWAKFNPAKDLTDYPNARMSAFIHDKYNHITYGLPSNDTDVNKSHVVGQAECNFPKTNGWKRFSVPFTYTSNQIDPEYIIVNFSTNAYPGAGSTGDELFIDDVELIYNKIYTEDVVVSVDGEVTDPMSVSIEITNHADGTIDFSLKNFQLNGQGIGTITLPGVELVRGTETATFSAAQSVTIQEGDDPNVAMWLGPMLASMVPGGIPITMNGELNDDNMEATIDINLMGQSIKVYVGYELKQADVAFGIDYATLCLPFAAEVPEGVTAYTLAGLDGKVLNLADAGNELEAGKAYILQDETHGTYSFSQFIGKYFSDPVIAEEGSGSVYLQGVFEATAAPVGSYVLQNLNDDPGFYQVASGKQPSVPAYRCYLVSSDSSVKGYKLNPDGTGIAIQTADEAPQTVYDLSGRRVTTMQKGIYIVNGKKVLK